MQIPAIVKCVKCDWEVEGGFWLDYPYVFTYERGDVIGNAVNNHHVKTKGITDHGHDLYDVFFIRFSLEALVMRISMNEGRYLPCPEEKNHLTDDKFRQLIQQERLKEHLSRERR
jgi:hypothetical protein